MYQAGLVLEGGGMKGVYTSGVLDFFLEKDLEFSHCYGVSAGACNLCSFLSKQKRRGYRSLTEYMDNKRYCGVYSLLTDGNIFNSKFAYDLVPNYLLPFDYETYKEYPGKAYAVATNLETGRAEYLSMMDAEDSMKAVQASASLPLVSRNVEYRGKYYLDGGIADSIPIQRSILDGNRKNVVVLTKEMGYRRKPGSHLELIKVRYRKYPKVYELMKERHTAYNETMDYLMEQVKNGQAFVIQPKQKNTIGRIEKDSAKMEALYRSGYEDAESCYEKLLAYLEG
ncbi:MAG: patatin family protein [Lachnospiraceae bacterium]|nr:patatin family protein [Lachnospiraceae bacterium]